MQIDGYDNDKPNSFSHEEKFSSFTEMLDRGWSMNHSQGKESLIRASINEVPDDEIENGSPNEAKLSERNIHDQIDKTKF